MSNQQYSRLDERNIGRNDGSVELESLVSSEGEGGDDKGGGGSNSPAGRKSSSSRNLSQDSPPVFDNDDDGENEESRLYAPGSHRNQHSRSMSVSTIGDHMFNLQASRDVFEGAGVPLEKRKSLNLLHGLGLVIGLQIGSGVFASPSEVNSNAGSVFSSLMVWLVAGLLAWTGASSFAELGSAIPLNGSSQAYLHQIFGPFPAFLFSWTAWTVLKPGGAGIIAIIFGEYFSRGFAEATGAEFFNSIWVQKIFALLGISGVTILNSLSTQMGANAGNLFMFLKIALLLSIAIIGLVAWPQFKETGALHHDLFEGGATSFGQYAVALYAGLWAYDGWDNMNYVSAEMKNTRRDLPRVIHIAMPVVILAYILANVSYFAILSKEEILQTTTVTLSFANKIFGKVGGAVFALLISFSCLGSLNATMFSSARLVYSAAEEGFLHQIFAKVHPERGTPLNALILQASLTAFFVIIGNFRALLTFYGVAGYIFYFLTVFGVIVLRIKEPDLERPYKTFISTPVMFCCVALFLVSRTVFEKPLESLCAGLFILSGCPIYFYNFGLPFTISGLLKKLKLRR